MLLVRHFIEVCAGAGGLSLGFHQAGFVLLINEIDTTCCETLRMNHPDWNVVQGSMSELDLSEFAGKGGCAHWWSTLSIFQRRRQPERN
jgi:site-specific DNA-cytosine methylase